MKDINVEEYNSTWKMEFQKSKTFYEKVLKEIEVEIVHVGSTSIEGLWAKPILDIDIIVNNATDCELTIESLKSVGYIHIGNLGIEGREAFTCSVDNRSIQWMAHNLYVCIRGNENLRNHLLLKKHLLENENAVVKYSTLKRNLAKKYPNDIDSYVEGKTELIIAFLKAEGMSKNELARIVSINNKIGQKIFNQR